MTPLQKQLKRDLVLFAQKNGLTEIQQDNLLYFFLQNFLPLSIMQTINEDALVRLPKEEINKIKNYQKEKCAREIGVELFKKEMMATESFTTPSPFQDTCEIYSVLVYKGDKK